MMASKIDEKANIGTGYAREMCEDLALPIDGFASNSFRRKNVRVFCKL